MNMNKTEIKNKCRQILNSGVASLEGGEDFEFLCDVFKGHDDYESKTKGQRIRMISIKSNLRDKMLLYNERRRNRNVNISSESLI